MTEEIMHILETQQFKEKEILDRLLNTAAEMERQCREGTVKGGLGGKSLANIFYERSTRTRLSFETAMLRLGGTVIGTESASHFSSAIKGESLPDTIKIISQYADMIVLRHPKEGSAKIAAQSSSVPIINAGDGSGQHPTQALLDVYTIYKELGRLDDLNVAMVGDLLYGRTVHSLTYLLAHRNNIKLHFVSPEQLRMPKDIIQYLKDKGIEFEQTSNLKEVAEKVDVLYVTRIQKERFRTVEEYEKMKGIYVIDKNLMNLIKTKAIVMHPLPRVNEIDPSVDYDPRAAYFRQAENGLYVRMALLKMIAEGSLWTGAKVE